MTLFRILLTAALLLFTLYRVESFAVAQEQPVVSAERPSVSVEAGLDQHMDLDLRSLDIVDTLKFLAMKSGLNIIASAGVSGQVSLFLKGVTIRNALDIILQANNLAYEKRGDIIYVMTDAEYKSIKGSYFKETRKVRLFSLKYVRPEAVFKTLDTLKSDIGKVLVDEETGTVVVMDTPEKIAVMEPVIAELDQQPITRTFVLQYAKASDVQPMLATRLDQKKTGIVTLDVRGNALIVTALPGRMKEVEELVVGLDKKTKQVLLEARILKVVLSDQFAMGVDWDKVLTSVNKEGVNMSSVFDMPSSSTSYFKLGMGGQGHNYSFVAKALEQFGETRNLSSPSIAVTNGETAKIHVGTSQPYVTTTLSTGATTSATAAQVTFIDVGVRLEVTPLINDEGFVTMKIKPVVSSVDSTLTYQIAASVNNTVPVVASTTAETNVMVKDATTIIIGGLRKDEKLRTVKKVPLLGNIPVLGAIFRSKSDVVEKNEIVVFITPHIISGDQEQSRADFLQPRGTREYK